jgi:hypothetical protein
MSRKDTWTIVFGARTKEMAISGLDPARVGLSRLSRLDQLPQMPEQSSPLCSSRRADRKTYMVRLIWSPNELITNFERFSHRISQAKSA